MLVVYVSDASVQLMRNQAREAYLALPLHTPDHINAAAAAVHHRGEFLSDPRCPDHHGNHRIRKGHLEEMHEDALKVLEWASANSHHAVVSAIALVAHHTQHWVHEHSLSQEN